MQAKIKENIKAPRHWPWWCESTGDRWIHLTNASDAEIVSIWWRHHGIRANNSTISSGLFQGEYRRHRSKGNIQYHSTICHGKLPIENSLIILSHTLTHTHTHTHTHARTHARTHTHGSCRITVGKWCCYFLHINAKTKWPTVCRRHFVIHILGKNASQMDYKSGLVNAMPLGSTSNRPLHGPVVTQFTDEYITRRRFKTLMDPWIWRPFNSAQATRL